MEQDKEQESGEKKGLTQKVNEMYDKIANEEKGKKRKKRSVKPRKAKLSKGKRQKGYIVVMKLHENRFVDFEKVPVEESAYKLKEDTYHALPYDSDVFFYKGKYPMVIQPTTKKNPYNPLLGENETKGQKHIMNLMSKHAIKEGKKKAGNILIYLLIGGAAIFAISKLVGG